jgi:chloramphenicol-sensitive protein RarD
VTSAPPLRDRVSPSGLGFAFTVYVYWGFLPLAFVVLAPAGAVEIVSWRILFGVLFCALLVTVTRGWSRVLAVVRDRTAFGLLSLAAVLILINWGVFIYATLSGHVLEGALGYFINPIFTVLLGVIVLRERLRPLQWVAVGVSAIAVVVLVVGYGSFPWIAITLATSFALYGFVKRAVGPRADAIGGMTVETAVLSPLAVVALVGVHLVGGGIVIGTQAPWHTVIMLSLGALTATPLILFAAAARRLPLVYMGLIQYLAPVIQFMIGVWILHEAMPPERWLGFGLVWLALILLTVDMFVRKPQLGAVPGHGT